ncbi:hypothetical protein J6TS7_21110 [Paenibacillus dendritiformis]|uniref:hypothetical protein n=1 Tax=Paenibacillus TaxID=44249 RepID=UPI001AFDCFFB|nr:hypothetical protein [Paenibacillus dendritiformis]GIO78501.1 hypothetical protein J6TS7_21110 [Paenibacillus dendritiformis]
MSTVKDRILYGLGPVTGVVAIWYFFADIDQWNAAAIGYVNGINDLQWYHYIFGVICSLLLLFYFFKLFTPFIFISKVLLDLFCSKRRESQ